MRYGPLVKGFGRTAGLCDFKEWPVVLRALASSGGGSPLAFGTLRDYGFFVCRRGLEDEWLPAVGAPTVLRIIEEHGDLPRFRRMQRQLAYRSTPLETQVRHLMTQKKIAYASSLIGPGLWVVHFSCAPRLYVKPCGIWIGGRKPSNIFRR